MIRTTSLDPDDPRNAAAPRELNSRISDGIHVQLLWYPHDIAAETRGPGRGSRRSQHRREP